ncbi:MAG: class I SAM-dependent methyltransferase [Bdellovibrionota bacterium]
MGKLVGDLGSAMSATMVLIGDKLGLYRAMAEAGPVDAAQLAKLTGTQERYVREWLGSQAAGGYVSYDTTTKKFTLPPEQAMALADPGSPVFFPGAFQLVAAMFQAEPKIAENFKTGKGLDWCDHDHRLFEGTERFFRPGYAANLVSTWIPALTGVDAKLKQGGKVADVGCGHGASTIVMAKAYPKSKFVGFDFHAKSIEIARERTKQAGVSDRVSFEVAKSTDFPGRDYDLVTFFDCLHDMGDPTGASRHVHDSLSPTGSWMIVEPFAGDRLEDNLNPVGRIFYSASTTICVPASLAHQGPALGAQAGEAVLKAVVLKGGFKTLRRATQTPFNLNLEARR